MRKFQSSVRGSANHANGPSLLSPDSHHHHHQVPIIKVVETVDRGAQINTIDNHNQLSKESEIVQLRTQLDDMMKDQLEDSQLRSRQWQAVGIESENLNLKQQLIDMQHAADDDAYKMNQMVEAYTVAIDEIEREYERSLELAIQEGKDLRMKLRNYQEDNERVISTAMKENELLREELQTCRMELRKYQEENERVISTAMKENELLREELHNSQMENEITIKATMKDNEILREEFRHEIRLLKDEILDVNTRCKAAEQESESRRRIIINIECKYNELKRKCEDEINNIKDDHRQCIEDNTGLMVELRELAHSLETITVEKKDAENLLNSTLRQRENNENELHREIRQLQVELNDANTERGVDEREIRLLTNKLHATQKEFYVVREELGIAMEERDVMKSRLVLVNELMNALEVAIANDEEKTLSIDRLKDELQRALADKAEVIRRYSELEVEYEGLQVMKDSESDLTVLLMKQRDSLTARIEKYMDEIDSMRQERGRGQQERDLLKDELICVLETATSIFPQLTPKDLDEMSQDKF
jgi:chromosome segregation ATPase